MPILPERLGKINDGGDDLHPGCAASAALGFPPVIQEPDLTSRPRSGRIDAKGFMSPTLPAKRAKLTKPHISQLESGARRNPSLPALQRLAKALGVPAAELLK